jgi:hypothetical protein
VFYGVREVIRESERSLKSSKDGRMLWWFSHLVDY